MKKQKIPSVDYAAGKAAAKENLAKESHRVLYWSILVVLGLASLLLTFVLVPLILFVNPIFTYLTTLFFGLLFGFVFAFLIMDLNHLQRKHHILLSLYIPAVSVLMVYLMVVLAKGVSEKLGITILANPIIVAFFLLFSFVLPYLFFGVRHVVVNRG